MPESADTRNVNRGLVLLNWQRQFKERVRPATPTSPATGGAIRTARDDFKLYLPETLIDYFNIPKFTGTLSETTANVAKIVNVKKHNRKVYAGLTDTVRDVDVREHGRLVTEKDTAFRLKSMRVPIGKVTAKGNIRTVTIGFPQFFTLPMIAQAIGTMTANANGEKKPSYFWTPSGTRVPVIRDPASGPIPGLEAGAWVSATQTANPTEVEGNDTTKRSRAQSGGAKDPSDNQT